MPGAAPSSYGRMAGGSPPDSAQRHMRWALLSDNRRRELRREELVQRLVGIRAGLKLRLCLEDRDHRLDRRPVGIAGDDIDLQVRALGELLLGDLDRKAGFLAEDLRRLVRILEDPGAGPLVLGQQAL